MDLDRLFEPEYLDSATDLFTNRMREQVAFATALAAHVDRVRAGRAVLAERARRNVLVYYGVGGIGKTELSRRLERWIRGELDDQGEWGPSPEFGGRVETLRIDFHGRAAVDATDIVLTLRTAVAAPRRRFPAFDLALAAWWSVGRPGVPIPQFTGRNGLDISRQIVESVSDAVSDVVLGVGVGSLTLRSGMKIIESIRSRTLRNRALNECEPLRALAEHVRTDPSQEVAATLAGLLSWDLERLPAAERPIVVAFADAVEYIQGGDRVQERLLNRVVHLTPGVLWVVTSRRSLDWYDATVRGALPAVGPDIWPGLLLGGESDQFLVGNLDDADVDRYLHTASGTGGNPPLTEEMIARIRAGAHGLPLYLDLSMSIARAAAASGQLEAGIFGRSMPELVTRVLSDLPEEERDIARAASLIPRFAPDLVARAVNQDVGDAYRLCQRTLVTRDDHPFFPYRLHDAVRAAIQGEPVASRGAWASEDWHRCAQALLEVLREQYDGGDTDRRLAVVELAAGLCAAHGLKPEWLRQNLLKLPSMGEVAARLPQPDLSTWIGQISAFYHTYLDRTRAQRVEELEALLRAPLEPDVRRDVQRFLAYNLRAINRSPADGERALQILREALAEEPDSMLHRYQVARTLRDIGRYDWLAEHLAQYPLDETTGPRIQSDLAFDVGKLAESVAGAHGRAAALRAIGQERVALENQAAAIWRRALLGQVTVAECESLAMAADRHGRTFLLRTALAAKAIAVASDPDLFQSVHKELLATTHVQGEPWDRRGYISALVYGLQPGREAVLAETRERWVASRRPWSPGNQIIDYFFTFAGYQPTYDPPASLPEGGPEMAQRRWHANIERLLASLRSG